VQDSEQGAEVYWQKLPAAEADSYDLAVKSQAEQATYNSKSNIYYDLQVSKNNFYRYQLFAKDLAENLSAGTEKLVCYVGKNFAQKFVEASEQAEVSFNNCTITIPYNSVQEKNLFVVQSLESEYVEKPVQPGRVYLGEAYRLLASERTTFNQYIKTELEFDPAQLEALRLRPETIRSAYWDGESWSTTGLINQQVDLAAGLASADTDHFTDFIILADQEYTAYDFDDPVLKFTDLRNGDFADTAVSFNLSVNDATTAVNTNNMWLIFDGTRYEVPSYSFTEETGSAGKSGKLAINLDIIIGNISKGDHQLTVFITDMASNTSNAQLQFSNKVGFAIDNVLNCPNPFDENGTYFTYNLSQKADSITIKIFTTNGKLIKELSTCANEIGFNKTFWDGHDEFGRFVANDVYLYAVIVETPDGEKEVIKGKTVAMR
jgi:hypothetical protein